jgi:hypothetical protein
MRSLILVAMLGLMAVLAAASFAKSGYSRKGVLVYYVQSDQKLAQRREATPPKLVHLAWLIKADNHDEWNVRTR